MKSFILINRYIEPLPPLDHEPKKHGHPTRREIEWFEAHAEK